MDSRIRVDIERTGGFGGLTTRGSADTDALAEDERRRLTELVDAVDVEALAAAPPSPGSVPDAFRYDVLIERDGRQVRLHAQDPQVPAQLRPLIRFVVQRT